MAEVLTAKDAPVAAPLPITMLVAHPDNPRTHSWDLDELVDSIRQHGVLTPLLVRPAQTKGKPSFQILAGHRRFHAAVELEMGSLPCRILQVADADAWAILLGENIQRKSLNLIEEARAYQTLRARGLTVLAIANRLGCSEQRVSRRLGLLELPKEDQERILGRELSLEQAWRMVTEGRINSRGPKPGEGTGRHSKYHSHFNQHHPLADAAGAICDGQGHDVPPRLGPACGWCWEEAIRDDQHLATEIGVFGPDDDEQIVPRNGMGTVVEEPA